MNEEYNEPNEPKEKGSNLRFLWLPAAFLPSLVAIACFGMRNPPPELLYFLLILDVGCSVASAIGLVKGLRNEAARILLGFILVVFFFVLNIIIALFVGCSGAGGIAP